MNRTFQRRFARCLLLYMIETATFITALDYVLQNSGIDDIEVGGNGDIIFFKTGIMKAIIPAQNIRNISSLNLANNSLRAIAPGIFTELKDVVELDLSYNQFSTLHSGNFQLMKKLKILYLNHNSLNEINVGAFDGLKSLRILQLHHNVISSVEASAFNDLVSLQTLTLNNNIFTTLPYALFEQLQSTISVLTIAFTPCVTATRCPSNSSKVNINKVTDTHALPCIVGAPASSSQELSFSSSQSGNSIDSSSTDSRDSSTSYSGSTSASEGESGQHSLFTRPKELVPLIVIICGGIISIIIIRRSRPIEKPEYNPEASSRIFYLSSIRMSEV